MSKQPPSLAASEAAPEKRARAIRDMFCEIAPRYDLLNHLLSLGIDRGWRRSLVRMALRPEMRELLDVACGTGDVCLALRQKAPRARIVGLDFSPGMLELAREKNLASGAGLELIEGSAEELPFADHQFDLVTIAFGIRNVVDRKKALREFCRVLRPGGRVAVLEFSRPRISWLRALYDFYFFRILPRVGGLLAKKEAYRYLPDSVARFPEPEEFRKWLLEAGFSACRWHSLTFGIATLYLGEKEN